MRPMKLIVAGLVACLPACGAMETARPALIGNVAAIRSGLARVCPRPTSAAEVAAITAELESLDADGMIARVDHLAAEWDRLNAGAKVCRGK